MEPRHTLILRDKSGRDSPLRAMIEEPHSGQNFAELVIEGIIRSGIIIN
jgi:hypothetical protein